MTRSAPDSGPFRVRISRVIMKDGGADVRVLPWSGARNPIESHLREWTAQVLTTDTPPVAYAAVAFWLDPETPGRPSYNVGYITQEDRLPTALLVEMAGFYLRNDFVAEMGKHRALEAVGFVPGIWDPDPDDAS